MVGDRDAMRKVGLPLPVRGASAVARPPDGVAQSGVVLEMVWVVVIVVAVVVVRALRTSVLGLKASGGMAPFGHGFGL